MKLTLSPPQTQLFSQASRRNTWEEREDRIHNFCEESQHSIFLVIPGCHNCEENPSWASLEQRRGLGRAEQPETIAPRNINCCTPHIQDANSDAHMLTLLTVSRPIRAQQKAYKALHSLCRAVLLRFSGCPGGPPKEQLVWISSTYAAHEPGPPIHSHVLPWDSAGLGGNAIWAFSRCRSSSDTSIKAFSQKICSTLSSTKHLGSKLPSVTIFLAVSKAWTGPAHGTALWSATSARSLVSGPGVPSGSR